MVSWKQIFVNPDKLQAIHCVKSVRIRSYFLVRIQSKYGEMPTRKSPNTDNFHAVIVLDKHKANDIDIKFVIGSKEI